MYGCHPLELLYNVRFAPIEEAMKKSEIYLVDIFIDFL